MKEFRCNKCARPIDDYDSASGVEIYQKMGYKSSHDGETVIIRLCIECLDNLIDSCKIDPVEHDF